MKTQPVGRYELKKCTDKMQMLRERIGIELVVAPLDETGGLDLAAFGRLLGPRTRLVAVTHLSNVTGHIVPVGDVVRLAHAHGAKVLLDGCQAAPRLPVDVRALDCDFYVLSGHKCYGPTGIGVLYAKRALLDAMPPWQAGGDMIATVTYEETTYQAPPHRFEAGTPDISGAIGLALALDFMESLGRDAIRDHEDALTCYARDRLAPGNVFQGPAIVEQMDTTTLIPPGVTARVDTIDNLILELSA